MVNFVEEMKLLKIEFIWYFELKFFSFLNLSIYYDLLHILEMICHRVFLLKLQNCLLLPMKRRDIYRKSTSIMNKRNFFTFGVKWRIYNLLISDTVHVKLKCNATNFCININFNRITVMKNSSLVTIAFACWKAYLYLLYIWKVVVLSLFVSV